ncbi:MAG: ACP S-malonyltransferase [Planctomycetes bacterium]|nr:ACP S-malonyltransferase [Planctomycetota bacterium]
MKRVALICPGRGSYARAELGSLARLAAADARQKAVLQQCDALRTAARKTTVSTLDAAERFSAQHLAGENAAALIFAGTLMDAAVLRADLEVLAVGGNSMGFYSALAVSGALDITAAFSLADGMGSFQSAGVVGGQVVVPICDAAWRPSVEDAAQVEQALRQVQREGHTAAISIRLGGTMILAGDDAAVKHLLALLPKSCSGERDYPFQLLGHSAFHTALMEPTSRKALLQFSKLCWSAPRVPLVDGRGAVFRPRTSKREELLQYTLATQVTQTYDFTNSVRVILREYAPEALVLLGPGESLGGSVAQVLIEERWQGLKCRDDFVRRQKSSEPLLLSLSREEQRALVV